MIKVDVYDHDTIGQDDFIGRSSWSLDEIKKNSPDGIFRLLKHDQGSKMNHLVQHSKERQAELAEQMNVSPHDDSKLDRQGILKFFIINENLNFENKLKK